MAARQGSGRPAPPAQREQYSNPSTVTPLPHHWSGLFHATVLAGFEQLGPKLDPGKKRPRTERREMGKKLKGLGGNLNNNAVMLKLKLF